MEISNGRMTVKFTEVEKEYTYPAAFAAGEIEVLEKKTNKEKPVKNVQSFFTGFLAAVIYFFSICI